MKIQLTFKTPDVEDQLSPEELEEARPLLDKFMEYGEYITVEFDTETGTCVGIEKQSLTFPLNDDTLYQ